MLQKLFTTIKNIRFSETSVPWILLSACILSYGLLIPQLGYFQDDWSVIFNHYLFGDQGIVDLMAQDGRPFATWLYLVAFNLSAYRPIVWHISALIMRWLTVVTMWSVFRMLWPKSGWQNLTAALFFTLYPFFTLQPLAATFVLHWTGYFLYGLSIFFMLQSLRKRYWLYTILALLTQVMHLFTLEFYSGIELLRPIFLWIALGSLYQSRPEKLKSVLRRWAPYLVVFILYFVWRGFIYQAPAEGRNAPVGLTALLNNPFSTLISVALTAIPDMVLILISSWFKILEPIAFDFNVSINRYTFLLGLASFCYFLYYLWQGNFPKRENTSPTGQMLAVGVLAFLFGLVPIYVAGFEIHTKLAPWNSRFSLGSLFGAALIITALIDFVVKVPKTRWIIIAALIGLLINWHVRYTNDFRWVWDKQLNFYRQLYLRAPELTPGTALLSEEEFLLYMGNYSTSYGINLIYAEDDKPTNPNSRVADYWFFTYVDFYTNLDAYLNGEPFSIGKGGGVSRAGIRFQGEPQGSVVISFEPGLGQCLWIMRPEYARSKSFSQTMRQLAPLSYVDRIKQAPLREDSFLFKYLDPNPEQDWCYYYEKADLAYQYGEWDEVIQLWETARQNDLQPDNGFEYLPFIEAYAHRGAWDTAKKMTRTSQKTMQGIDPLLCDIWSKLEIDTPNSTEKTNILSSVREDLKCEQE
jgi:hypothetical protein